MERKSLKCPPMVEPNQFGCVWSFSGLFDHHHHHHGRPHRKMLADESHGSKSHSGNGNIKSQERMLTFDEQLKNINVESKRKISTVSQSVIQEANSSNPTRKNSEIWKNNTEKSFWKRIISRYESPIKKNKDPNFTDKIVILKPIQRAIECPVDVGCRCSNFQPNHRSTSRQQIVKHTQISFNDVKKKLKTAKKVKNTQKIKSCEASELTKSSKSEKLVLVPILKNREPEVFVEARRHLAERLKQIAMAKGEASTSSSKRVSRTLERILISSPIHEPMANFGRDQEGIRFDFEESRLEFLMDVSSSKVDCKLETIDTDQFRENPSPVSVLDPFFTDNISSPTSTIESAELQVQPRRLDFEEHSSQTSSPPYQKTNLSSSSMEDQEFIYSFINTVYETSQSNWEEFLVTDYPSEDHKLLHDCVKEVLIGLNSRITFVSSKIRPFSLEKDVVNEVIEKVDWHNGRPAGPRTLDNLVRRDIDKSGLWVNVSDGNDIVFEVVDEALEVLIMEAISDICV